MHIVVIVLKIHFQINLNPQWLKINYSPLKKKKTTFLYIDKLICSHLCQLEADTSYNQHRHEQQ